MKEVLLDALIDSLKILLFVFIANEIIGIFEGRLSNLMSKSRKFSPLIGSTVALIPQCGISVVSTDLYIDGHISIGTILAVYIATSDEALPILASSKNGLIPLLVLLLLKIVLGVIFGYLLDSILKNRKKHVSEHLLGECHHDEEHHGCCNHNVEDENKVHRYLIHPLKHSLKTFIFIFIVNVCFGLLLYYIGEEAINSFLIDNIFFAPLITVLLGLIPNCASSVIISNLYILGGINFGALVSGLIVNSGLGIMILMKNKEHRKDLKIILPILISIALVVGYVITLIEI